MVKLKKGGDIVLKKIITPILGLLLLGCADETDNENVNEVEKFTAGESIAYEIPNFDSQMNGPTTKFLSNEQITEIQTNYELSDDNDYLSEVQISYKLKSLDNTDIPYTVFMMNEDIANHTEDFSVMRWQTFNDRPWLFIQGLSQNYVEEEKEYITINYTYAHRAGFELYLYRFKTDMLAEEYGDLEVIGNTYERMEEIVRMADFTHAPTMTETEILEKLNGVWDSGEAGYLEFEDKNLKWYQDSTLSEDNVIHIELIHVESILHPTEETEYGVVQLDYLSEVINGETRNSNVITELTIYFKNENELILVDPTNHFEYQLQRVE